MARIKARLTGRLRALQHEHDDGETSVAEQIGMLDHIAALAEARYGNFNPTRVQQLRDHLTVAESFIEALYTETPYVNVADFADDDPRKVEALAVREHGFAGWKALKRG